ncbi:hypothetical protein IWW55_002064 [Coemansia sp. RSA 2706]|nr:hypothetical protein LPJ70_007323 [Coemansia sp. RSA 2708]KAJ1834250.1 hypothetical protein LPJ63_002095 [Coemansia sp. RSA 2711]KAJ2305186.1 hypothetical protein IWW55_002064 [Coemansia sp. RSA 2706]
MDITLQISYDRSLGLKASRSPEGFLVKPSNTLQMVVDQVNVRLKAQGEKALDYRKVKLVINNTSSGIPAKLTNLDTLDSKGIKKVTAKYQVNTATLYAIDCPTEQCIIL